MRHPGAAAVPKPGKVKAQGVRGGITSAAGGRVVGTVFTTHIG